MAMPKSVRLDDELEIQVEDYLKKNKIKLSQLINMSVRKFIAEPQTITLIPANTEEVLKDAESVYQEHQDAMDKLK